MLFAMVLCRRPISQQANSRTKFIESVRNEIRPRHEQLPVDEELYARIVWFHRSKRDQDVDNIIKPLLDAMQSVVYHSDKQVRECAAIAIDASRQIDVADDAAESAAYGTLLSAISATREPINSHVVYIEIGRAARNRVAAGLIDGGSS